MKTSSTFSLGQALGSARETRGLEISAGALQKVPQVFLEHFGTSPAVLVADENTFEAAGAKVAQAFEAAAHPLLPAFVFPAKGLYAAMEFVTPLEAALAKHSAIPVVIGSGTLNDLTKLAAHRVGRSYLCVATAASMDGYTAFGASITDQGSKRTFTCPAPRAVVADLEVIAQAPGPMNSWGYADLVAKVTAGADWLLADALGVEPLLPVPWAIVQGRLRDLIARPGEIPARIPEALSRLVEGLMLGGFAMQAAQSSRPASGAEHQFSHLWDMQHHTYNGRAPSHGFKVAIGTLAVTALYEALLQLPLENLDVAGCCAARPGAEFWREQVSQLFGEGDLATVALQEVMAKNAEPGQLRQQLERVRQRWPELRARLREQLMPFESLKSTLQAAGVPTEPEQIGISRQRLRESFWQAYFIRRRFTVLDLAVQARLLEPCVERIFGPGGAWPLNRS